jgi:hypothetical protein
MRAPSLATALVSALCGAVVACSSTGSSPGAGADAAPATDVSSSPGVDAQGGGADAADAAPDTTVSSEGGTSKDGSPNEGGVDVHADAGDATTDATAPADASQSDADSGADAGSHPPRCDDAGHCACLAIASIGHEGVWGPCSSESKTALQDWLNADSSARVDTYDTTKPTLTVDFLAQYDVLVLQWMVANGEQGNDGAPWQFSTDEVNAVHDWVNAGGGIIALSGYQGVDPASVYDIVATNQLLSFTDIQFNRNVLLPTASGTSYCWGGAVVLGGPADDGGVASVGTWASGTPLGAHVTSVGALDARSIASTSATVDCTDGTNSFAVHEAIGQGHVFAYGDEWITYSDEANGTGTCIPAGSMNPQDPCYGLTAPRLFQIPQLWYNAIRYAAPSATCFNVASPSVVP